VLFVFFSGSVFADPPEKLQLTDAWGTCGFATRWENPSTGSQWSGSFSLQSRRLTLEEGVSGRFNGYARFREEHYTTLLESLGDDRYRIPAPAKNQPDFLYTLQDGTLQYLQDDVQGGRRRRTRSIFFQIPGNRLGYVTLYAESEVRQEEDFYLIDWEGGYTEPYAAMQIPTELNLDFSHALINVNDPSLVLPGDKFIVPLRLENRSLGTAAGVLDLKLHLYEGGPLIARRELDLNLPPGADLTVNLKAVIPLSALPGNFTWHLVGETAGIPNYSENKPISAFAPGNILVRWFFGEVPGRKRNTRLNLEGYTWGRLSASLTGGGYAVMQFGAAPADVSLTTYGTNEKSVLKLDSDKNRHLVLGNIASDNSLKAVIAPYADLYGDIHIAGTLEQLVLSHVLPRQTVPLDHTISFDTDHWHRKALSLKLGTVHDLLLSPLEPIPLKKVEVLRWLDTSGESDLINAHWIGSLTATGDRRLGTSGDFQADIMVDGVDAPRQVLVGDVKIDGRLDGALWTLTTPNPSSTVTAIKKLDVGLRLRNCRILADGNIGLIRTGAFDNARILVGIAELTGSVDDFGPIEYSIAGLKLQGDGLEYFVNDSQLGAWSIGNLEFPVLAPLGSGIIQYAEIGRIRNRPTNLTLYDVTD